MAKKKVAKIASVIMAFVLTPSILACSGMPLYSGLDVPSAAVMSMQSEKEVSEGEVYELGATFTIPANDKIVDGIAPTAILVFPSGRAVSKNEIVLNEVGKYVLRYDYIKNGTLIDRDEHEFTVKRRTFEVAGNATAEYVAGEGIVTSLTEGSKLVINEPIKVSDLRAGKPFVTVDITPETYNVLDFNRIIFKLTDTTNPENYVSVYVRNSYDSLTHARPDDFKGYSYALAGAFNQAPTGREGDGLCINGIWGSPVPLSFWGLEGQTQLEVTLDVTTCEVTANNRPVIDLDDFNTFSDIWNGFDGDEVLLEISADNYQRSTANFTVKKVSGVQLDNVYMENREVPRIETEFSDGVAPDALAGAEYPVPQAWAYDARGNECNVSARVFSDYGTAFQSEINVFDGRFIPEDAEKTYTILYSAADSFGKVGEWALAVRAKESLPDVKVSATVNGRITSAFVGERVTVSEMIAAGGTGALSTTVEAVCDGNKQSIENGTFVPARAGKYAIVYTATDYIGRNAMYVYNIDVQYSEDPIIDDCALATSWVSGYVYDIPIPKAYIYSANGKTEVPVTVSVTVEGKAIPVQNGKIDLTAVSGQTEAKVTYTSGSTVSEYQVKIIPGLLEDGSIDYSSFFSSTGGVTTTQESRAVRITATDDGSAVFERSQVAEGFNCNFSFPFGLSQCEGVELRIQDSVNLDEEIGIVFSDGEGGMNASINGGTEKMLTYSPTETLNFILTETGVMFGAGMNVSVKTYANGASFDGFSSGLIKISFIVHGVKNQQVAIDVSSIFRQMFRNGAEDNRAPNIGLMGTTELLHTLGDIVVLPEAICADVLNPQSTLTVTMRDPNGNILTAEDGTKLENVVPDKTYNVKLDSYGEYTAIYEATDLGNGRTSSVTVRFIVEDKAEFDVEYAFSPITEGEVGKAVAVPKAVVKTQNDVGYTVNRFLVLPNNQTVNFEEAYYDSFVPTVAGKYIVRYMVIAETGNFTVSEYTVTVTQ